MLTHARLLELVHYDPKTGIFTAKVARARNNIKVGQRLGSPTTQGYLQARIEVRDYLLHRLAWFYMTGRWPPKIDHRNRKGADNRWENLREATQAQNRMNSDVTWGKVGIRGVYEWRSKKGVLRYRAAMQLEGRQIHLGLFDTPEEARKAFAKASKIAHGSFAEHLF